MSSRAVTSPSSFSPQPSSLDNVPHPSALSLPLANEVLALQTLLKQRDERIHALHAQLENARTDWGSEQVRFENEISALRNTIERLENSRIEIVLDHAMTAGRIAPAEREFWNTQLRRDFEIRHEELKMRPEVMHMKSVTGDLGKQKVDLSNADTRKKILFELLEAKQRQGMSHNDAWFAVKAERPDVFAAMGGNH